MGVSGRLKLVPMFMRSDSVSVDGGNSAVMRALVQMVEGGGQDAEVLFWWGSP